MGRKVCELKMGDRDGRQLDPLSLDLLLDQDPLLFYPLLFCPLLLDPLSLDQLSLDPDPLSYLIY